MWTPAREDLARELAGEIGDEDSTLVDRAEERASRFEDYSDKRKADAETAHAAVAAITDNIPMGQPILVGHHSERRARKDAERIEEGMRRAVQMWETSEYWTRRAKAAIQHAKYKERPDVRARRIKGLEADKRKHERDREKAQGWLKMWTKVHDDNASGLARKDGTPSTFYDRAVFLANHCGLYAVSHAEGGPWSAWDVLRPDGERYQRCPAMTPAEVQAIALRSYPATIAYCERWIAHLDNRLAYERAMLDDAGGTVSDRKGPQVGGAVRCWASPAGGWAYIQKVNKVSVSLLDDWGNGGGTFTRTIPFDKLAGVMTRDEVEAARIEGRLVETENKAGFYLHSAPPPKPTPEAKPEAEKFEQMKAQLATGVQVVSAPQLFPTPPAIASAMAKLADLRPGMRVLEPSAGTGALLRALPAGVEVCAVEVNTELALALNRWGEVPLVVLRADFLSVEPERFEPFDRILMNPPFADGEDIAHIVHARKFLAPGGRLVALCANGSRQRAKLAPIAASWEDLPPGSFESQGTGVNVAMLTIEAAS